MKIEQRSIATIDTEIVSLGEGRPVLFLHSGDGLEPKSRLLSLLAESHKVVAPSHPGFGHSARPDDVKTVEDLAYFYLDLIDELDLDDVTVVGSSFGGWIAAEIAVRSCAMIRDLVLIDTVGVRFADRDQADIADIFMLSPEEIAERAFVDPAKHRLEINAMSDDDLLVVSRNRVALCQYAWSPYMHNPRLKRWLHRIKVPTLLVWGENDGIVSPDYGRRIAAALPQSIFVQIEKAGHYPHIDHPDEVARVILQFVEHDMNGRSGGVRAVAQV